MAGLVVIVPANAQSYEEGFRLSLQATVPLANRQWFLANEAVEADPQVAEAYDVSLRALCNDIDHAKAEGVFDANIPTPWIAEAYQNLTYAAWSLVRQSEATPKQAADFAWRTLARGLKGQTQ